jgi:hypothetical protein
MQTHNDFIRELDLFIDQTIQRENDENERERLVRIAHNTEIAALVATQNKKNEKFKMRGGQSFMGSR